MANYYDYFESFKVELPHIISGWLDNCGKFYECYWGQHTSLAYEIVRENNWVEECFCPNATKEIEDIVRVGVNALATEILKLLDIQEVE